MQSVEEFMQQYFDERITEERREQVSRAPFRQKFHTEDCRWDSRAGTLEMIQSERVLRASSTDTTAEVITSRESSRPDSVHQLRYHLQLNVDRWLIRSGDLWCSLCHGEAGTENCMFCHGTGWLDGRIAKAGLPKREIPPHRRF